MSLVEFYFDGFGFLSEPIFFIAGEVLEVGLLIVACRDGWEDVGDAHGCGPSFRIRWFGPVTFSGG